jgi:hypothetical protein
LNVLIDGLRSYVFKYKLMYEYSFGSRRLEMNKFNE